VVAVLAADLTLPTPTQCGQRRFLLRGVGFHSARPFDYDDGQHTRRVLSRVAGRSADLIRPVFRMEIATLVNVLDHPHQAAQQLHAWGLRDVHRAQKTLLELADSGLTLDLLATLCDQLAEHLPQTSDADAALDGLTRFLFAARSPLAFVALAQRDPAALPMLLAAISLGPRWAELLANDPEAFDFLRETGGQPLGREEIRGLVLGESLAADEERSMAEALLRLKRRHELRVAYGEFVLGQRLELAMEQLTWLAESLIAAALEAAQRQARQQRPLPARIDPARLSCSVIALERLGGGEMDYAGPAELLIAYDAALSDANEQRFVSEHFERVAKNLVRLLAGEGDAERVFDVQLTALPDSAAAISAHAADDVALGFESFGRTWHRHAMLRARTIAGDLALGQSILGRLEAWMFRKYLSGADETGVRAWKRRIQATARLAQDQWRSPSQMRGGLRDLESTVQFLQLLFGGDHSEVRAGGVLPAIAGLELAGVLTAEERRALEESFQIFRRLEHRLQLRSIEPGKAELPADEAELRSLIQTCGDPRSPEKYCEELRGRYDRTWVVLERLLTSAFAEEPPSPREVDLLLDPNPSEKEIGAALAPFGFAGPQAALAALQQLAQEQVPFLSTRRCRHLLSQILPQLLCAVAATPSPDRTLDQLLDVSNSLGGKGALWELFRFHPPSLQLYVRLCAASPYLSGILTTNPGMMDELIDSLQRQKLPAPSDLQATLNELCHRAADTLPILHDFKNAQHLRIGVRDMLGKEDIDQTHQALADVAETCLAHVARLEYLQLVEKFGVPTIGPGPFAGELCRPIIVGLGKLGGREPNYHSDLEVLFLYEADGLTRPTGRSRRQQPTANNHFFTQFAQRILKQVSQLTPKGRLYPIEALLRPIGVGGALALSLADFAQHFKDGAAPLWQWLALCKARPVFGEPTTSATVQNLVDQLLTSRQWADADRAEVRQSRLHLERGATPLNIKRGPGGTADVEYLAQMLQLQHSPRQPQVLATSTQEALQRLAQAGALENSLAAQLGESYRYLRRVESGLRLLETKARHDLPTAAEPLHQLALLVGHSNPAKLRDQCLAHMADNRIAFLRLTEPAE
jgi:[glutamine synthetase] adenylyltransferase / [glutamine synthetase]-adenylyl-L-tyrosine phosphorylase